MDLTESKVSRRKFITYAGVGGAAIAAAAAGAYYLSMPAGPTAPTTTAGPEPSPQEDPLYWHHVLWGVEMNKQFAADYEKEYNEKVIFEPIPGDVPMVLETKFIGGAPMDVVYAPPYSAHKWYKAGWIKPLDDLPNIDEVKKAYYPNLVEGMTAADGHLIALDYCAVWMIHWRNNKMLDAAGYGDAVPKTFDEFLDVLRQVKSDKVAEYPFIPYWFRDWFGLPWIFVSDCMGHGETFVDEDFNATFDVNTGIMKCLETWKAMWDEKLVPPESFTIASEPDYNNLFMTGNYAFGQSCSEYNFIYNNPSMSKIAGQVSTNPVVIGDSCMYLYLLYTLANRPRTPRKLERVTDLMYYLGWKDRKTDEYSVSYGWMDMADVWTGVRGAMESEKAKEILMKDRGGWRYIQTEQEWEWMKQQRSKAGCPPPWKAIWTQEWEAELLTAVPAAVTGEKSLGETVEYLRDFWDSLKKRYT